jgi:arginine exporter protein ArgO
MYREQEFGVLMLFTSIATSLLAFALQALEYYSYYISLSNLFIYLVGILSLFYTGWNTYKVFNVKYHISRFFKKKDAGKYVFCLFLLIENPTLQLYLIIFLAYSKDIGEDENDVENICAKGQIRGYNLIDRDIFKLLDDVRNY